MIITKLKGGLGNQMFQYAAGFALAQKNNTTHKIDISGYDTTSRDTPRKFSLNVFNITSPIALSDEINKVRTINFYKKVTTFFNQKILRNYYTDFHPNLFKVLQRKISSGKNIYLDGIFQSEKNFIDFQNDIRKEFTFKKEFFDEKVLQLAEVIQKEQAVSIHIRRGDYVQDKKTNTYHGVCPIEYYKNAAEYIITRVPNATFYIFTDDEKWASENVNFLSNTTLVSKHHFKDHEEMYLMSQCSHHIIANSSFSWWGAWLNKNSDKIVIAPKQWVNKKPNPHPNIIPDTWLKI